MKENENIYDIRHEKNLYFIFPTEASSNQKKLPENKRIAVFVNLFYLEDLDWYLVYLRRIPESIHLFVFSSNDQVIQTVNQALQNRPFFWSIKKENRGRDVSALLVAAKPYFQEYDYACFIHDKKTRQRRDETAAGLWIENLWENMLSSESYIYNIINLFENKNNLGLLVPPEPIGEYINAWYFSSWLIDFEHTKELAEKLGLHVDLSEDKPPISLSTVFWCRPPALKKLISQQWKYEDFMEEPLPRTGTLSHAIERIFSFVAQDAGFDTGTVMTEEYAAKLLNNAQYFFQQTFAFINRRMGLENIYQIGVIEKNEKVIQDYFNSHRQVFLYGAGYVGRQALTHMKAINCLPKGFLLTCTPKETEVEGMPVISINDFRREPDMGIIVTVSVEHKDEIVRELQDRKIVDYLIYDR